MYIKLDWLPLSIAVPSDATPPIGKIHQSGKIAVTFEQFMKF